MIDVSTDIYSQMSLPKGTLFSSFLVAGGFVSPELETSDSGTAISRRKSYRSKFVSIRGGVDAVPLILSFV